jgi:hypothetical protein
MPFRKLLVSGLAVSLIFILAACGDANPTATLAPVATSVPTATTKPVVDATVTRTTAATPTTPRSATVTATSEASATSTGPSLTEKLPERTVIRTFTDAQNRTIKLIYGRGTGHGGDYGWGHIYGKHVQGIWYDGGTITTFPKALGAKTPEQVVDLIGKSLQDKKPDDAGNGRRSYVYAVPGTNRDVFTVVGNDGTIITSYPVAHGSKDEDS